MLLLKREREREKEREAKRSIKSGGEAGSRET